MNLNILEMNVEFNKSQLADILTPKQLEKYILDKGWKFLNEKNGYKVYCYHPTDVYSVMIANDFYYSTLPNYISSLDLKNNFVAITKVHDISEMEIVAGIFNIIANPSLIEEKELVNVAI